MKILTNFFDIPTRKTICAIALKFLSGTKKWTISMDLQIRVAMLIL